MSSDDSGDVVIPESVFIYFIINTTKPMWLESFTTTNIVFFNRIYQKYRYNIFQMARFLSEDKLRGFEKYKVWFILFYYDYY